MSGFKIAEAFVSVKSDATGLREEVSRDVKEAGAGQEIKVGLKVDKGSLGGFFSNIAPLIMPSIAAVTQLSGVLGLVPAAAGAAGLAYGTLKVGMSNFADSLKTGDTPAQLKKANEALADLSPNAKAAALTVRGLGPAWDSVKLDVQNRLFAGTSQVIQQVAKADLPILRSGMDAMSGSLNLAAKYTGAWLTSARTTSDVKTIFDNSSVAGQNLARAIQPILGIIRDVGAAGSQFLPQLTGGFATAAQKAADFVSNARDTGKLHEWIQTGIDAVRQLWAIFGDLFDIIKQISAHQGPVNMLDIIKTITGGIRWLVDNMPELIPIIEGIIVAWKAWQVAQWALNVAMDANPIGLVIAAVAALALGVYELIKHWQAVKDFLGVTWQWIKDSASSIWGAIRDFFVGIWNNIHDSAVAVWNAIRDSTMAVWSSIRDFLTGIWNSVSGTAMAVWDAITRYFQRLWNAHKDLVIPIYTEIRDFLAGIWNSIRDTAISIWNAISAFFTTIWNAIKNTAVTVWNAIVAFFTPAFNAYRSMFEATWNAVSSVFTTVWNTIKGTATSVWGAISGFFTGAFNTFRSFFTGVWNGVVTDFNNIWGRVTGIAQTIWGNVTGAFRSGVNAVIGLINSLVDGADVVLKFLLIPLIPHIPGLATGGVLGLAGGGTVGAGFTTNGPMAIVGEGNQAHPEYVIPTDPAHRGNALALYQSLGAKLMAGGGILDWIGSTVSKVEKWTGDGALGLMNQAVNGLAGGINEPYRDIAASIGHKAVAAIKAMVDKAQAALAAFSAPFTGSGAVKDWIQQALGLTGTPQSWAGPLSVLIGRESGGNPHAINRTDSNAAAGHPSQGLMQTIPSTFNAYHQPGTSWNITDPVANIAAGINYIKARYGSIFNVQQANPNLPPKGYDSGGLLPTGLTTVYNGTGKPERVLSPEQDTEQRKQAAQMAAVLRDRERAERDEWRPRRRRRGGGYGGDVHVHLTQNSGSPAETGRFVALALRTVG